MFKSGKISALVLLAVGFCLSFVQVVQAQPAHTQAGEVTTGPVVDPSGGEIPTLDMIQMTTIAGVMVATTFAVSLLKRLLGNSFLAKIPAFVIVTVVALLLCTLARYGLKTLDGDIKVLLWDTLKVALASSGFYTWVVNQKGATPLVNTTGGAKEKKN